MSTKCEICNSLNIKLFGNVNDTYKILKCKDCGYAFIWPRPTTEELNLYYKTVKKYNEPPQKMSKTSAQKYAYSIYKKILKYNPNAKTILDIGCSFGHLLYGLKHYGYDVYGTDLSSNAVEWAKRNYNIKIFNAQFPPENIKFDVIIMSSLLEHIIEPKKFLGEVVKFLNKNGILIIGMPNFGTPLFNIFKGDYCMVFPPEHITFFNYNSLLFLINSLGLKTELIFTTDSFRHNINIYSYFFDSMLRKFRLVQKIRQNVNNDNNYLLSASSGITKRYKIVKYIKKSIDIVNWLIYFLTFPISLYLNYKKRGLLIFCIARKIND